MFNKVDNRFLNFKKSNNYFEVISSYDKVRVALKITIYKEEHNYRILLNPLLPRILPTFEDIS